MEITRIPAFGRDTGATEHMVRMRDGVRLATDVYLPDDWTGGPAILIRLPYDKRAPLFFMDRVAREFAAA